MNTTSRFQELHEIISRLRGDTGCPWDKKQTPESLKKYLLEESKELAEAIDKGDARHICEETGDLFFILILLCEIFREQDTFSSDDALQCITEKMIRRHPHVFAGLPIGTDEELRHQWETIKRQERTENTP